MKEATQLRANREIEADLHGKELEENSDDEKKGGRRKRVGLQQQLALFSKATSLHLEFSVAHNEMFA